MNIQAENCQSILMDFYKFKSKEINTPNELKKILVLRTVNGERQLKILQKKDLSFWEKMCAKIGLGNAAFANVINYINRNIGPVSIKAHRENEQVEAANFLNQIIKVYQLAHSYRLFSYKINPIPVKISVPDQPDLKSTITKENTPSDSNGIAEISEEPKHAIPVEESHVSDSSKIATTINLEPASISSKEPAKKFLILHQFSQEEMGELENAAHLPYDSLIPAKNSMNYNPQAMPEELKKINEKLVSEFRFKDEIDPFTNQMALSNQCHRSWGTNLDTLVQLKEINTCYPANRIKLGNRAYIQAEAPRSEVLNSKAHYYQMAIESGANLLVTATAGFKRVQLHGEWKITPHRETMDFLSPGESVEITGTNGQLMYRVECEDVEELVELPDNIKFQVNIKGPCHYHIRRLNIINNEVRALRTIYQIVPDFVSIGVPFSFSQYTVDLVNQHAQLKNIQIDEDHPVIVNCITGRDRSGQYIILDSMKNEIDEIARSIPVVEILHQMNVVDQLRARAFMLAKQSTEGAGIDSIEKTLLPCFDSEVPVSQRELYSTMSTEKRNELHASVNASYAKWARDENFYRTVINQDF